MAPSVATPILLQARSSVLIEPPSSAACNRRWRRLQTCVIEAATACIVRGCDPVCQRSRSCVTYRDAAAVAQTVVRETDRSQLAVVTQRL
eukprot:scaffold64406_cov36-Phaeocystis_antarctica.AAC.1